MNTSMLGIIFTLVFTLTCYSTAQSTENRTITCSDCTTLAELYDEADFASWELGQDVDPSGPSSYTFDLLVVSELEPISALFELETQWHPSAQDLYMGTIVTSVTTTEGAAKELDHIIFARKVPPVEIPSDVAGSANTAVYQDVNTHLRQVIPVVLLPIGGYHVADSRTGKHTRVTPGGFQVIVNFHDGSSAKMLLGNDPRASEAWTIIDGSQRDSDGNPYGSNPSPGPMGNTHYLDAPPSTWEFTGELEQCSIHAVVCVDSQCIERVENTC